MQNEEFYFLGNEKSLITLVMDICSSKIFPTSR